MSVPKGFKQTEVGVIPDDWTVKAIKEIAPLQRGFDLTNSEIVGDKYPVVYSNGIVNYHDKFQVIGPGVVTGRSGTIGSVHYIKENFWPHNTTLWITDFKGNEPKYIYYLYTSLKFNRFSTGSGVPTLNRNDLHDYYVPLPSTRAEQTSIATALSDMDSLIEGVEKLLEKKRRIKQGAMQELLTGKRRVSGFESQAGFQQTEVGVIPKDWTVKAIKEIAPLQRGFDLTNSEIVGNKYPVVYSNGIVNYHNKFQVVGPGVVTGRSGTIGSVHYVKENYWPHNTTL